jgi:hypothetical protein
MVYLNQGDENLYDADSFDQSMDNLDLDRVFEDNDFSYIMDTEDMY